MKRKLFILALAAITLNSVAFAENTETATREKEAKDFSFTAGFDYLDRQQGRMTSRGYEDGIPDDLIEDGDVLSLYTSLGYKINDKWSTDYTYKYSYIDDNERFGKDSDEDDGHYINHTFRLKRSFDPFEFASKEWDSSIYVGYRNYRESSLRDSDGNYNYNGFSSNRILFNANMNTDLSEKTALSLNYHYQYRTYNMDKDTSDVYNHRHYLNATINHSFNDSLYLSLSNTLYVRQNVQSSHNKDYGEWDYSYTLGHVLPLENDYVLSTEFTAWGEVSLWEKGSNDVSDDNQAELVFMPKIKKTYKINDDMKLKAYVGAGYVYGYDTRTTRKEYSGFEGRIGSSVNYIF